MRPLSEQLRVWMAQLQLYAAAGYIATHLAEDIAICLGTMTAHVVVVDGRKEIIAMRPVVAVEFLKGGRA